MCAKKFTIRWLPVSFAGPGFANVIIPEAVLALRGSATFGLLRWISQIGSARAAVELVRRLSKKQLHILGTQEPIVCAEDKPAASAEEKPDRVCRRATSCVCRRRTCCGCRQDVSRLPRRPQFNVHTRAAASCVQSAWRMSWQTADCVSGETTGL